jgi:hypothetical protein
VIYPLSGGSLANRSKTSSLENPGSPQRIVTCQYGPQGGHAVRADEASVWTHYGTVCDAHMDVLGELARARPRGRRQVTQPINDFRGIGVGSLAEFIEAGPQPGTRKLRQLKVKSETPSTSDGAGRPATPMYPEKETSPFLQWTSKARGGHHVKRPRLY